MTAEEIKAKAKELSLSVKKEVTPFSFITPKGKQIIGYLKDPERGNKMQALEMIFQGKKIHAGEILLRTSLLPESSSEILSDASEDDTAYISSCIQAANTLELYANELKKNESE